MPNSHPTIARRRELPTHRRLYQDILCAERAVMAIADDNAAPHPKPAITSKLCSQCNLVVSVSKFSWRRRENRFTSRCSDCRKKNYHENPDAAKRRSNEYYASNRDSVLRRQRDSRKLNIARILLTQARVRAKQKGLGCNLELADIVVPPRCPVLGLPLVVANGKCAANSPSLDRIDPHRGYVKGNVVVISFRANTIKNDATIEELASVLEWLRRITS